MGDDRCYTPLWRPTVTRTPVVAIVGRPNVGKSTLFNRILGGRIAIVDDRPGVTRDRVFARAEWAGRHFLLADTGGIVEGSDESMDRAVRRQALTAVAEAEVVLFVVDGQDGPHPLDEHIAELLRRESRPVLLTANKLDNLPRDQGHQEFWRMGLGEPFPVSAISGKGSGDLLDELIAALPDYGSDDAEGDAIRVAVVGRPNVGKSSLVNRLLGEDRSVVSDTPGTTRDAVDSPMRHHGNRLVFVDTAGLRRKAKVRDDLEYYSSLRTDRAVHDSDVCVVLVEATDPLTAQDIRVLRLAWDAGKGVVLLVNKWDLVAKDTMTAPRIEAAMRSKVPFLNWVPIIFISVLTGLRARACLEHIPTVEAERRRRVPTSEVNEVLGSLVARQPPPVHRGRNVKLRYATQAAVAPPTFAIFANYPRAVPDHYVRYLHNGFRAAWRFEGSPVRIRLRSGRER